MKANALMLVMMILFAIKITTQPVMAESGNASPPVIHTERKVQPQKVGETKYLGYSVDGRTSPSVLAAQRSHTVAGRDERNFAVFTGIAAILIIYFLIQIVFKRR